MTTPIPVTSDQTAATTVSPALPDTTEQATPELSVSAQDEVVGVGGAKASEYVKAAAFLGGAIAYLPLASSWLGAVGYAYYNQLFKESGWDANVLDLPDKAFALKGYEIVVNATNPLVPLFLFVVPFALLTGMLLGLLSLTFDYVRTSKRKPPLLGKRATRAFKITGRISYAIAIAVIFFYSILVVVYLAPNVARNSADALISCVKGKGDQSKCSPPVDYGYKSRSGRLLVSDKSHIYLIEGMSYRRITLDDASVTYFGKRPPEPSPTTQPSSTTAVRGKPKG